LPSEDGGEAFDGQTSVVSSPADIDEEPAAAVEKPTAAG
jgi:hypothetical protein